jgi:hypothetical protein
MYPFEGDWAISEIFELRKIREKSPSSLEFVGFESEVKADLREDPQLMEKYPQPIPRISKVVGSLQDYIRRPSHGGGEKRDL